jgi:hypothetical protein
MKLDRKRAFGLVTSTDPKAQDYFTQDGIDYDKAGNPKDPEQVRDHANRQAAAAQSEADDAMAAAQALQERAETVKEDGDLMVKTLTGEGDGDDEPVTKADFKALLDGTEPPTEYASTSNLETLKTLWADHLAAAA